MQRYNLIEAKHRLKIPENYFQRIKYLEIKWKEDFATGTPLWKPYFFIISTGNQLFTDAVIIHEIFGHGMNSKKYEGSLIEKIQQSERDARKIEIEKLLDLEQEYPGIGYENLANKLIIFPKIEHKNQFKRNYRKIIKKFYY